MRTYTTRSCRQKTNQAESDDLFFAEKAFKSPLDLSKTAAEDDVDAPQKAADSASKAPTTSKRQHKISTTKQTKKMKTMKEKSPVKKRKTSTAGSKGKKRKNPVQSKAVTVKDLPTEIAALPMIDQSCADKVNSWLETCVEDDGSISPHSSIELWRGEEITVLEKEQSLFPDEFYKNLGKPVLTGKRYVQKKNMKDEMNSFFSRLHAKRQCTPVKKTSFLKPLATLTTTRSTEEGTECETRSYTVSQTGTQSYSTSDKLGIKSQTGTQSYSTSDKIGIQSSQLSTYTQPELDIQASTEPCTTALELETESGKQPFTSDFGTKTSPVITSDLMVTEPITQSSIQSCSSSKKRSTKSAPKLKKSAQKQKANKSSNKSSSSRIQKSNNLKPMTSTRLFKTTMCTMEEAFPCVSAIKPALGGASNRRHLEEKTPYKLPEFKQPNSPVKLNRKKPPYNTEPKTSTRLFDDDVVDVEENCPSVSAIRVEDGDVFDRRRQLEEKTPYKLPDFKQPTPPVKKRKKPHNIDPKTSTRLFDGDTVNIEENYPSVSTIRVEDDNTDCLLFKKDSAPVKTSTPQDKHPPAKGFHFDMDLSSVNQDSSDDSIGLHFEVSGHEVNSEEIIHLSTSQIGATQFQTMNKKRSKGRSLKDITSMRSGNFLSKREKKYMVSVDKKRALDSKKIQKIQVCPLMMLKGCTKIVGSTRGCRFSIASIGNEEGASPDSVPDDIYVCG